MISILILILGIIIVGVLAWAAIQDEKSGLMERRAKEKVLALLAERSEMSNSDLREALGLSDRPIVRYMDELEREDKVEQVGPTGRNVTYRLK